MDMDSDVDDEVCVSYSEGHSLPHATVNAEGEQAFQSDAVNGIGTMRILIVEDEKRANLFCSESCSTILHTNCCDKYIRYKQNKK